MIRLEDYLTRRAAEWAKVLAGCVLTEPAEILPLLERINPGDLRDDRARDFLALLRDRKPDGIESCVDIAIENGYALDYCRWLALAASYPLPADDLAEKAIIEIQRLVIARNVIRGLQEAIREKINYAHRTNRV